MKYCLFCMRPIEEGSEQCPHCGKRQEYNAPEYHLAPGTVIGGKFMIGAALGEGGFGITYVGVDVNLQIRVAVKEYFPNGYANRSSVASTSVSISSSLERQEIYNKGKIRFLDEARTLAKFTDELGVVQVRDFFEANNTAYIVMEFLDGITLKDYVKKNGLLNPAQAVELLAPVMQSLKKVHTENLIHRDISPDNIMVLKDRVKLLDFGAARSVSAEANKSLSVVLKPGYAPEEQYRTKGNQGPWTDVYAMSATIYKVITGVTPDDSTERLHRDEIKAPSAMGIAIAPAVERALLKGLAVFQENRYQDMEQLLNGLRGKDKSLMSGERRTTAGPTVAVGGSNHPYKPPVSGGAVNRPGAIPKTNTGFYSPRDLSSPGRVKTPVHTGRPPVHTGQPLVHTGQPPIRTGTPSLRPAMPVYGTNPYVAPVKKKSNAFMVIWFIFSLLASAVAVFTLFTAGLGVDFKAIVVGAIALCIFIPFIISLVKGVKKRGVKTVTAVVLCLLLALVTIATSVVLTSVVPELRYSGTWYGDTGNYDLHLYANGNGYIWAYDYDEDDLYFTYIVGNDGVLYITIPFNDGTYEYANLIHENGYLYMDDDENLENGYICCFQRDF